MKNYIQFLGINLAALMIISGTWITLEGNMMGISLATSGAAFFNTQVKQEEEKPGDSK